MTVPAVEPTTAAVLERLETLSLPVGDARKPEDGGWQGAPGASEFRTYLVCYPLNHRRDGPDAPITDRHSDPQLRYQITGVGIDRRTVEMALDLAAGVLLNGVPFTITGRTTIQVVHEFSAGVSADETTNPPLFVGQDRYRIDTGPA